jgi:hypothetical protein
VRPLQRHHREVAGKPLRRICLKGYLHYLSLRVASERWQRIGLLLILSATSRDKVFIASKTKSHLCPAHYFPHEIAESVKVWRQKRVFIVDVKRTFKAFQSGRFIKNWVEALL